MNYQNGYPNINQQQNRGQNQGYQQLFQQSNQGYSNGPSNGGPGNQNQTNFAMNNAQNAGNMFHMNMQHGAELH